MRERAEIDEATNNDSPLVFGNNCHIATGAVGDAAWCGWIDEVRLVDDVKSADWVAAEYAAMTGNVLEYHRVESLSAQATSGYQEGDEVGGLVVTAAQAEWLNGYLGGFADKAALETAIAAAVADGIALADKYTLNLDPTTADSYELKVTGIEVDGATVTVTVTLTRANGETAVSEPIRGTLKLQGTAELGTDFGETSAQDISGAFNNKTTETFEFTDTGNAFFKAVIE